MIRLRTLACLTLLLGSLSLPAHAAQPPWLQHVPERVRSRQNPLAGNPSAAEAGKMLYRSHCAVCHGADAAGRGNKPDLRPARLRRVTDGELSWLLQNGSLARGMPSWSRLPEQQRWQLIAYLRSLP